MRPKLIGCNPLTVSLILFVVFPGRLYIGMIPIAIAAAVGVYMFACKKKGDGQYEKNKEEIRRILFNRRESAQKIEKRDQRILKLPSGTTTIRNLNTPKLCLWAKP